MSQLPISEYPLLSDCHSAALVSRDGSIDWLCFPRIDGPPVFARLLDERGGHWSLRPVAEAEARRRYQDQTMLLETTFRTATGGATLVDAMAVGRNERGHEMGAGAPSVVLRQVTGIDGEVAFELDYAPCLEYGLASPVLELVEGGVMARGGVDVLALSCPLPLAVDGFRARARVRVRAGETVSFALHHRSTSQEKPRLWSQAEVAERVADTAEAWRTWSSLHQSYEGPWRHLVHESGRVLYALTYYPTGARVLGSFSVLKYTISVDWDTMAIQPGPRDVIRGDGFSKAAVAREVQASTRGRLRGDG